LIDIFTIYIIKNKKMKYGNLVILNNANMK